MSIVSNSIINADAEARYLSPGELDQIKAFVTGGQRRLRVAQVLCESRERIVKQAGGQLFQKRPDVISPGGNAYGEEMTATCLRDMDYYLRLVTYGIVAGDVTPIEEIGVIGAKELYRSLGTPLEAMAGHHHLWPAESLRDPVSSKKDMHVGTILVCLSHRPARLHDTIHPSRDAEAQRQGHRFQTISLQCAKYSGAPPQQLARISRQSSRCCPPA